MDLKDFLKILKTIKRIFYEYRDMADQIKCEGDFKEFDACVEIKTSKLIHMFLANNCRKISKDSKLIIELVVQLHG